MSRELALKLACISDKDRQWVLNNLSEEEKSAILPLIKEVEALGLNKDPTVIESVMSSINGIAEQKMQSSALKDVQNIGELNEFWQSVLLGCIEKRDRGSLRRKHAITLPERKIIEDTPSALKQSIIRALSA